MVDRIFKKDGMWFFWDETLANYHGPFKSRTEAEQMLQKYNKWLGGQL